MKKVLSNILILFIVLANLFAPLSVGLSKKNIEMFIGKQIKQEFNFRKNSFNWA